MRGRPKLTSLDGLPPDIWLTSYLRSGSRSAAEVMKVGEIQGFSSRTLRRAKQRLGIVSDHGAGGSAWYWRDPSIEQPKPKSDDKTDMLLHEVQELKRLTQAPKIMTEDGPWSAPDLNEVDELSYKVNSEIRPEERTVSWIDVQSEIRRLKSTNPNHPEIVDLILKMACPYLGLPESFIVKYMISQGIVAPSRIQGKPEPENGITF